mmetsp:Transcript_72764/g.226041  ORF Transcript_72764/g.226041 Transcript_72764/m.226041 type:complete len:315 (+) Transcript_72764:478-1422(+)
MHVPGYGSHADAMAANAEGGTCVPPLCLLQGLHRNLRTTHAGEVVPHAHHAVGPSKGKRPSKLRVFCWATWLHSHGRASVSSNPGSSKGRVAATSGRCRLGPVQGFARHRYHVLRAIAPPLAAQAVARPAFGLILEIARARPLTARVHLVHWQRLGQRGILPFRVDNLSGVALLAGDLLGIFTVYSFLCSCCIRSGTGVAILGQRWQHDTFHSEALLGRSSEVVHIPHDGLVAQPVPAHCAQVFRCLHGSVQLRPMGLEQLQVGKALASVVRGCIVDYQKLTVGIVEQSTLQMLQTGHGPLGARPHAVAPTAEV